MMDSDNDTVPALNADTRDQPDVEIAPTANLDTTIDAYLEATEQFCQDGECDVSIDDLDALLTAIEASTADFETVFELVLTAAD